MNKDTRKPCIYNIPSGLSFVDVLARGILDQAGEDPTKLARMQILLPTRRACRSLREAFLRLSGGKPLLLPRMTPLGDVDEEELSLTLSGMEEELELPPAISPMRRQFLLAKLIAASDESRGLEQNLALASALARLMDQAHTEDLSMEDLPSLVEEESLAQHWQVSVEFLKILSEHWPKILAENGMIDPADRRNRLLKKLTALWSQNPPGHPVIAAGSTGSIPATAAFLKTIAAMEMGCIVLPGLDQYMDEESWQKMDDTHPQATLRQLLQRLDVDRRDVIVWPQAVESARARENMRKLASEIMRPAETSQAWQAVAKRLAFTEKDLNITRYDCAAPQEEALTIAVALREVLETPGKTAAVVTPDRKLARRVAMACRRWNIEIDDSGGQALSETRVGSYLRLCVEAVRNEMKPVALLNFCKHALCLPKGAKDWRSDIRDLDRYVCRGPAFRGGMDSYRAKFPKLEERGLNVKNFKQTVAFIENAFTPLLKLKTAPFKDWTDAHLQVCEYFSDPALLWSGQDGEAAALYFSELREQSSSLPDVTAEEYLSVLELTMQAISVRPAFGLHPRLMILGQLEARLVEADVMILSGLNEKTWPPDAGEDPWMSRPMRKKFGLPSLERSIGLSAHDFAQALCAKEVILTRSLRVDGTPTVPSRWLQRMDTVLKAAGLEPEITLRGDALEWARQFDHSGDFRPRGRPEPKPPVSARPRQLPVTKIETWMKDPYGIYARYILNLKKLEPLEQKLDAAMRGTLIHDVLHRFIQKHPKNLPANAEEDFAAIARQELEALGLEEDVIGFWTPRLAKIAAWFAAEESKWREEMLPAALEIKGQMIVNGPAGNFTLTAKADRIDKSLDGASAAIIDYKSGKSGLTKEGMINGKLPQLPLEMLILESGGFGEEMKRNVSALSYIVVNGGGAGGEYITSSDAVKLKSARENAKQGLEDLITAFDDADMPYYSLPRPEIAPKHNDYEHLARVREWAALEDGEEA